VRIGNLPLCPFLTRLSTHASAGGTFAILEFQKVDRLLAKVVLVVLAKIFEILSKEKVDQLFCRQAGQFLAP
jgi:hypothetical protein